MKKVFIKTYGCQMNVADSERMAGTLVRSGYELVKDEKSADVVLLNTCSVRALAEEKVFSKLGELGRRKKEGLVIGVVGCMAQQYGDGIFKRAPYVDLVCGTYRFHKIGELVREAAARQVVDIECLEDDALDGSKRRGSSVCAWVPIMRGCNNRCSYCVVPYVRGPERSRPLEEIIDEISGLPHKEITLLGQNVNSYKSSADFVGLLQEVNKIEGLERIRFVTSHPKDASTELFKAIRELDKVCEYLHLPIQSGSNRILERMNREYTKEHYLRLISFLPDIALSADIIVGFPGETEEDFQDTLQLMKDVEFDSAFIFKYSPRPGTPAAKFIDDVPLEVKKERNQRLLKLQDEISLKKNKRSIGTEVEVLVEGISKNNKDRLMGRTRRNKIVVFSGTDDLTGKLVKVKIVDATAHTLYGDL